MKKFSLPIILLLLIAVLPAEKSNGQTIELLAGNTLNGAMNGTILGGAAMALNNSNEFDPLRVGLGLGVLSGMGIGIYDLYYSNRGDLLVSGMFNDGENSSIIILLDTFYGVAAGGIIGTSVMLVANRPLLEGLQYGAGAGAIAGFGFGLFDSFVLAERFTASGPSMVNKPASTETIAEGIVSLRLNSSTSLGLINPGVIKQYQINRSELSLSVNPKVEVLNLRLNF